jgi:hypothetical protein
MEKETAVEWLIEQLFELRNPTLNQIEIMKQAKEMERQQIEDAWNDGNNRYSGVGDSETYYETFKKK